MKKSKFKMQARAGGRRSGGALACAAALMLLAAVVCGGCSDDEPAPAEPPGEPHMKLNVKDSLAMVKLYKTIGPWVRGGWDLTDYTTWLGVGTAFDLDTQELRIVEFNVINGEFHDTIPDEIGDLTELRVLIMTGGVLQGSIPEAIGNLKNLEYMCIGENHLSGKIPESVGNLKKIKRFQIKDCDISGSIPESIGDMDSLEYLSINFTNVSGEIPKSLSKLEKCTHIWLNNNKLSGTFPIEAASPNVRINCKDNNIEELPVEIWSDDDPRKIPDLQGNRITTTIPKWVTEQEKWKQNKGFIELQQKGYAYVIEEN